jgi:hypothetical protein
MPTFEIKNNLGTKIWSCEAFSFRDAIEMAVVQNINLYSMNLQEANLQGANLEGADLQGANLQRANLEGANLQGANLRGANLQRANLQRANLQRANLEGANLEGADLRGANLEEVILRWSNLQRANLQGANLWEAKLWRTSLFEADLRGTNLEKVNLKGANLQNANLLETKLPKFQIPQRKSLIVYKKLRDEAIATFRIPSRAARTASVSSSSPEMRTKGKFGKCRAERAFVVAIEDREGKPVKTGHSLHNPNFLYEAGKEVKPEKEYDPDIRIECTSGIHFFMTKEEAKDF